ncbi:thermonuclease family protein [Pseudomonas fragariae (ex Marin et al. 2024)]|uniref:thermonuclease family protein n=1 Tax=Pseudomonas fragariae (ex Marin et al. 2024) TaxID=3080056 RepID=UPI003F7A502F
MQFKEAFVALLLTMFVWAGHANADSVFQGEVIRILDGDTIEVMDAGKQTHRVRLADIDAPERKQAFGDASRQALASMAFRQKVSVLDAGGDRYGRRIGVLIVNGQNLNREMVAQGMAWVYTQYSKDKTLTALEETARTHRRGLWADAHPIAPWDFRHSR